MKDCLIIGPETAQLYNQTFQLLRDNVLRRGISNINWIEDGHHHYNIWLTTLNANKTRKLNLTKTHTPEDYQHYDDYDAIESTIKNIPYDYYGKIGVPISFFYYYPDLDYEILEHRGDLKVNGKTRYERLIIRRKGE